MSWPQNSEKQHFYSKVVKRYVPGVRKKSRPFFDFSFEIWCYWQPSSSIDWTYSVQMNWYSEGFMKSLVKFSQSWKKKVGHMPGSILFSLAILENWRKTVAISFLCHSFGSMRWQRHLYSAKRKRWLKTIKSCMHEVQAHYCGITQTHLNDHRYYSYLVPNIFFLLKLNYNSENWKSH